MVRIGVAVSDPDGLLATPVETVPRGGPGDLARIAELVAELEVARVVVGLPRTLSGAEGSAASLARRFARSVAHRVAPVPVVLVDERLTTVSATRSLRAAGVSSRRSRRTVDQAAAVVILQQALDSERAGDGDPAPAERVEVDPP